MIDKGIENANAFLWSVDQTVQLIEFFYHKKLITKQQMEGYLGGLPKVRLPALMPFMLNYDP